MGTERYGTQFFPEYISQLTANRSASAIEATIRDRYESIFPREALSKVEAFINNLVPKFLDPVMARFEMYIMASAETDTIRQRLPEIAGDPITDEQAIAVFEITMLEVARFARLRPDFARAMGIATGSPARRLAGLIVLVALVGAVLGVLAR